MTTPKLAAAEKAEKWVYAGARSHGKLEQQVLAMITRIRLLGLTDVKIELQSEETFLLRKKLGQAEADYRELVEAAKELIEEMNENASNGYPQADNSRLREALAKINTKLNIKPKEIT